MSEWGMRKPGRMYLSVNGGPDEVMDGPGEAMTLHDMAVENWEMDGCIVNGIWVGEPFGHEPGCVRRKRCET